MATAKINLKGLERALEQQLAPKFRQMEREANAAAARCETPEAKAEAFARVMEQHGVKSVNRAALTEKFRAQAAARRAPSAPAGTMMVNEAEGGDSMQYDLVIEHDTGVLYVVTNSGREVVRDITLHHPGDGYLLQQLPTGITLRPNESSATFALIPAHGHPIPKAIAVTWDVQREPVLLRVPR